MLEHLRIIELGQVIAGTFGGMILSDLGADVIKVEPPRATRGDVLRSTASATAARSISPTTGTSEA